MRNKKVLLTLVIIIILAIGGTYYYFAWRHNRSSNRPKNIYDLLQEVVRLNKAGNIDGAIAFLKENLQNIPPLPLPAGNNSRIKAELNAAAGLRLINERQYPNSISYLQTAKSLYPRISVDDWLTIAYLGTGDTEKALKTINAIIQAEPSTASHYYYRGLVYLSMDNTVQVKENFQKVLQLDPNYSAKDKIIQTLKTI